MKYDGELKNWYWAGNVIVGNIYNDSKGRFYEGQQVRTSRVLEIDESTGWVKTLNSVYKLGEQYGQ